MATRKIKAVDYYPCGFPLRGEPQEYIPWHQWAERKFNRGWRQKQCAKCASWHIWIAPKKTITLPAKKKKK